MPTPTFDRLRADKRSAIIESLFREFSTYPLSQAQVARIVTGAGISRGAFYTYFTDLEDAYACVLRQAVGTIHGGLTEELAAHPSDTLTAFSAYTERIARQMDASQDRSLFRMHWLVNQYRLSGRAVDSRIAGRFLDGYQLTVSGHRVTDQAKSAVIITYLMNQSHDTIRSVLAGESVDSCMHAYRALNAVIRDGLLIEEAHDVSSPQ